MRVEENDKGLAASVSEGASPDAGRALPEGRGGGVGRRTARARKWRWLSRGALLLVIIIASPFIYATWEIYTAINGFQPPEMARAQHTPRDVIGDLGGMKVRIPRHYAEYVEYDGDPGFGEKRKG
ncbi:MAG: hypothetical protein LBF51_05810, partial [Zoogloeaceae bacterium]|nr:hypothetical protein [Zoogloeaceae bacterium]